jgi:MFS transporter, PPP family, 3-phenylpropionic acid transporter
LHSSSLRPFALFAALYYAYAGLYSAYLPLYLKELGFATFAIAVLCTVNNLTRCIGPYTWGWLGDHTGKRLRIVRVSCVAALAASAVLFAPPYLALFFIGLLAMNLATSSMTPLTESMMIARLHGPQGVDWGRYGRLRLWGSIGFSITVIVSGWLFERLSISWFAASVAALLAALWASSAALPADTAGLHTEKPPRVLPLLRSPVLMGFYVASFFMVAAHTGLYVFFSLYLDQLGYSKAVIGLLWASGVLFEIAWFYFQGRALQRVPLQKLWVFACVVAALRFALIGALGQFFIVLIITSALHFLTFAAHHTASMAFITRHFPGPLANRGMALFTTIAYGFGGVAGGLIGGKVAQAFGYGAVFYSSAVFATLAALLSWWVVKHDRDPSAGANKEFLHDDQDHSVLPLVS